MNYDEYLASPAWMLMRWRMLDEYGESCEFCGNELEQLHVHHLTYERLGRERPSDLAVLCWSCHADAHEFPKRRAEIERVIGSRRHGRLRESTSEEET